MQETAAGGRYARQALFAPLGAAGQERLRSARVLVVGCGALGSHAAELLARAGVGLLRLVDRDVVELTNLHRQIGFTEADAREGVPKAEALASHIARINSEVTLEPRTVDFNFSSALELSDSIDLLLDGSDNLPTRFLLNEVSLSRGLPWIYCGAVGETGHAQFFLPGRGPCLRCLLPGLPPAGEVPTCDTAGVLGPAAAVIASFQAAMAIRYLGGGPEEAAGLIERQVRIRAWSLGAVISRVPRDPACPACAGGARDFLAGREGGEATVLCGRRAVQLGPARPPTAFDLAALAGRLRPLGQVEERAFLLRYRDPEVSFTVFPDGRMIVEGTEDPARARAVYSRYVGE